MKCYEHSNKELGCYMCHMTEYHLSCIYCSGPVLLSSIWPVCYSESCQDLLEDKLSEMEYELD